MRIRIWGQCVLAMAALLMCLSQPVHAADDPQLTAIQQKLNSQFHLTKVTADRSDIVKAGSVVVLNKDGLLMCSVEANLPMPNTYKGGSLSAGKFAWGMGMGLAQPGVQAATIPQRKFVAGEKFWVTGIVVQKGNVNLLVYSDPYDGVRYHGQIGFPLDKKATPSGDDVWKMVSEVMSVEAAENAAPAGPPPPAVPAAAEPAPVLAPIAPPPPPPDEAAPAPAQPPEPKTVSVGQTKAQVTAILGQPPKIAKVGTKEIDYYPDMKVTFVNGKVTDIQ